MLRHGVLRHEVACEDLVGVILEKCLPGLLIAWGWSFHHVFSNRTGRLLDAELEIELFTDLVFAPARIIGTYAADEVDVLAWNCGSADLPGSRLSGASRV
jgi:hypothetical protein